MHQAPVNSKEREDLKRFYLLLELCDLGGASAQCRY